MNILAVEPFYSGSHKAFLKGLEKHSSHNIIPIKLNYKGWKWRMHGDSVSLAEMTNKVDEDIDLLLSSSMTNLPAFMALTNPRFAHTPTIMYMHDNQFTRPIPDGEKHIHTVIRLNNKFLILISFLRSQDHLHEHSGG